MGQKRPGLLHRTYTWPLSAPLIDESAIHVPRPGPDDDPAASILAASALAAARVAAARSRALRARRAVDALLLVAAGGGSGGGGSSGGRSGKERRVAAAMSRRWSRTLARLAERWVVRRRERWRARVVLALAARAEARDDARFCAGGDRYPSRDLGLDLGLECCGDYCCGADSFPPALQGGEGTDASPSPTKRTRRRHKWAPGASMAAILEESEPDVD